MLCLVKKDVSRFLTSFSISLEVQLVIEIGLQLPNSSLFPPLKIGVTFDFFSDVGKNPVAKHLFIILHNVGDIASAHRLYNLGDIWSGPSQLDAEKDKITFLTSSVKVGLIIKLSEGLLSGDR